MNRIGMQIFLALAGIVVPIQIGKMIAALVVFWNDPLPNIKWEYPVATLATANKPPPIPKANAPTLRPMPRSAAVQPGPTQLVTLSLNWDYPVADLSPDVVFNIYHASDVTQVPVMWMLLKSVTNTTTAQVVVMPGKKFYAIKTYSQFWQTETDFSDPSSTPNAPVRAQNLTISR